MSSNWLVGDHGALAAERILDAAGRCFARDGVTRTSIGDIASEAQCSRPTIYRYFEDRNALRTAFMHREARRLGAAASDAVGESPDTRQRFVELALYALAGVRANPTLAAWFSGADRAMTTDLAGSSAVIGSLAAGLLGISDGSGGPDPAQWVVRVILSLLAYPGRDEEEERLMLQRFVVPVALPVSHTVSQTHDAFLEVGSNVYPVN